MQIEHVNVGDATLWTARQGSGPPVVWCHGGPGLWDYLQPLADLCDGFATTYRYDQRGCGRSTGDGPFNVEQYVNDLELLRQHWGYERWIVGGHSWGAMLGLLYALAHQDRVRGLIYLSGVGINPSWRADFEQRRQAAMGPEVQAELKRLRETATASGALEDERAFCELQWSMDFADRGRAREQARRMFVNGARVNNAVGADLWADVQRLCTGPELVEQVRQLAVPALVNNGALDLRPYWPAQELSELLPQGEFVLLENSAHFPWVEQPQELQSAIRSFVAKVS